MQKHKTYSFLCMLLIMCMLLPAKVFAQSGTITGTVVDETGMTVIGATVMVKGTNDGTITDMDGNFSLQGKVGTTLVVSYVGYATLEVKVSKLTGNNLVLKEDSEVLEEVVVVGMGTQKRNTITEKTHQFSPVR